MIILTKYGNTVSITTKDKKVHFLSVKQFLRSFTLDKSNMTLSMDTDNIDVAGIPVGNWSIAGVSGMATVDDVGIAIKTLTEVDVD